MEQEFQLNEVNQINSFLGKNIEILINFIQ